jgi:elongation factor 1 alpha-like protein
MTAEDRESLNQGTIAVKAAIHGDFNASDREIKDALWYYYFDVDKTVKYLRGQRQPKKSVPKPQKKSESRFDKAAAAASERTQVGKLPFLTAILFC